MIKSSILLVISGMTLWDASAQQVIPPLKKEFLDSTLAVLPSATNARYRRETEYVDSVGGVMRDYYLSGNLQSVGTFDHFRKKIYNGTFETFFADGKVESHAEFEHGKQVGELRIYYPAGQLKRREIYVNDKRTSGECYAVDGKSVKFFEYWQPPMYLGGNGSNQAIVAAVTRKVKYPMEARLANIEGRVVVSFVVDTKGLVTNIKIEKSASPVLDEAAIKAVKELKRFSPGRKDGELMAVSYTVPINFQFR